MAEMRSFLSQRLEQLFVEIGFELQKHLEAYVRDLLADPDFRERLGSVSFKADATIQAAKRILYPKNRLPLR